MTKAVELLHAETAFAGFFRLELKELEKS